MGDSARLRKGLLISCAASGRVVTSGKLVNCFRRTSETGNSRKLLTCERPCSAGFTWPSFSSWANILILDFVMIRLLNKLLLLRREVETAIVVSLISGFRQIDSLAGLDSKQGCSVMITVNGFARLVRSTRVRLLSSRSLGQLGASQRRLPARAGCAGEWPDFRPRCAIARTRAAERARLRNAAWRRPLDHL